MRTQNINLGITNPKSPSNMGSILRAAGCYGVSTIFYTGQRYDVARQFVTDTKGHRHKIPHISCDDFKSVRPDGSKVIAVELVEGATPLPSFRHPDNGFYLFGPEDGSLTQEVIDWCDDVVYIPTEGCMNLAATVNVLLYDRLAKSQNTEYGNHIIRHSRDRNNTTSFKATDSD